MTATPADIHRRVLVALVAPLARCPGSTVTARVDGNVVHLEGNVPHRSDAIMLEALARGVQGVTAVRNRLTWNQRTEPGPSL